MIRKGLIALGLLVLGTAALRPEISYPWRDTYIGSLDGPGWPGLVIAPAKDAAFAFLLRVERGGESAEGADFLYLVSELGPHSPDGLYARVRFDLGLPFGKGRETPILMKPPPRRQVLTFEWSRRDESIVVGRILCPEDVRVTIVHYFPWDLEGEYALLADGQVRGQCGGPKGPAYLLWTNLAGEPAASPAGGLALSFAPAADRGIAFVAGSGDGAEALAGRIMRFKDADTIAGLIDEEAANYEKRRVKARGLFSGAPEAAANAANWSVLYQPGHHRFYVPAGRGLILPRPEGSREHWTVYGWDSFFSALQLALESQKMAVDAVKAVLETQYPNGSIPNWRGRFWGSADRSQAPVGAYVVLKLFERLGDVELLRYAYPYLQRWHDYWSSPRSGGSARRDGNGDGLLEWGSDGEQIGKNVPSWERNASGRMRAGWESGQDDLPNWDDAGFSDEAGTLTMNCLDLNSLYALDAWCLAEIASVLGRPAEVERYRGEYDRTKALVNAGLWNEKEGFYFDRHWDGRFSARRSAASFFPLIAGIPDAARAQRMLKQMLDPKKFWGDYVLPSISRDDPAFKPDSQQHWRGTVWPPANYLVYHGLKAYGLDVVAHEFARKNAEMYMRSWEAYGLSAENYDSLTGEAGGLRYHSRGGLAALIAVEEYLDFTPHEGFRFGMLKPDGKGRLSRVFIQGRHYEVEASNSATILREEGEAILAVDGGAVVRRFLYNESEISFRIKVLKRRDVKVVLLKKGRYQLLMDGREMDVFSGSSRKFEVPEGEHTVLIQLLEDLDKQGPPV